MNYGISIFKDKKENLLIIPQAFDENGIRRDTNKFVIIEKPYTNAIIGEKVFGCFEVIIKEPLQLAKSAIKAHEVATGIKSYKAFSKDRIMVAGSFNQETGYSFIPWNRYPDGSYGLDKGQEIEFNCSVSATAEEIGNLVEDAFKAIDDKSTLFM